MQALSGNTSIYGRSPIFLEYLTSLGVTDAVGYVKPGAVYSPYGNQHREQCQVHGGCGVAADQNDV